MAIYHCRVHLISRGKGQTAIQAAAYRSGTKLYDNETGLTADYTRKRGIAYSEILLPPNAPSEYADRQTLWNAVQQVENKKDSQLAREFELALPIEWEPDKRVEFLKEFLRPLVEEGMIIDFSIHDSVKNPHAHVMATTRPLKSDGTWATKERKVYSLDTMGNRIPIIDRETGEQKIGKNGRREWKRETVQVNSWNQRSQIKQWRKAWADVCNAHLSAEQQVSHLSYYEQGKSQIPTIHEGYVGRQIEKRNGKSERCQENRIIHGVNQQLDGMEQHLSEISAAIAIIKKRQGERTHDSRADSIAPADGEYLDRTTNDAFNIRNGNNSASKAHRVSESENTRTSVISQSIERRKRNAEQRKRQFEQHASHSKHSVIPDPKSFDSAATDVAGMDETIRTYYGDDGKLRQKERCDSCQRIVINIKAIDAELRDLIDTTTLERYIAETKNEKSPSEHFEPAYLEAIREIQTGFRVMNYIEQTGLIRSLDMKEELIRCLEQIDVIQRDIQFNQQAIKLMEGLHADYNRLQQIQGRDISKGTLLGFQEQIRIEREVNSIHERLTKAGILAVDDFEQFALRISSLKASNKQLQSDLGTLKVTYGKCEEAYRYLCKLSHEEPVFPHNMSCAEIQHESQKADREIHRKDRSSR